MERHPEAVVAADEVRGRLVGVPAQRAGGRVTDSGAGDGGLRSQIRRHPGLVSLGFPAGPAYGMGVSSAASPPPAGAVGGSISASRRAIRSPCAMDGSLRKLISGT